MAYNMLRVALGGKKKTINLTTDLGMQMLNGIPEDIDHEEFIEHARIEWIDVRSRATRSCNIPTLPVELSATPYLYDRSPPQPPSPHAPPSSHTLRAFMEPSVRAPTMPTRAERV